MIAQSRGKLFVLTHGRRVDVQIKAVLALVAQMRQQSLQIL